MAGIVLPNRFVRQPQYPATLDPYWERRIAFASISGLHGGRDLVTKQRPVPGSTASVRPTVKGMASYTGSVADGLVWSSLKPIPSTFATGVSFLVLANPAAQAAQQRVFFLGDETAAGGSFNQASFQFNCNKGGTPTSGLFSAFEYNFGFQGTGESTAGAVDGNWHVFIATRPAGFGSFTLYRDGLDVTSSGGSANGVTLNNGCRLHVNPGATIGYTGELVLAVAFDSQLSLQQVVKLSANPWQILKAPERNIWVAVSSGSTGTVAVTNANDTSSASGTTTIVGASATTNTNDTSSASGSAGSVSGTVDVTNADDTSAALGTTTVTGASATTNANDTSSATGTTTVTGSSATTNADDTSNASGAVGDSVSGSVAYTNAADTSAASGTTTVTGASSRANSNDTSAASGTTTVVGSSAVTNANDTSEASGFAGAVTGTVACTNENDTCNASGIAETGVVESFSGGYPYISRESHAERRKKQRIALGIIEEEKPGLVPVLEQFEISDLVEKSPGLVPAKKQHIPARQQKKLDQEAINAELKALIQLELDREEEAIIRMLMDL